MFAFTLNHETTLNGVTNMTKFQIGKTYQTRSICDSECVFSFTVFDRTDKTIVIDVHGERVKRKVYIHENEETAMPLGRYSMAPCIKASRQVA